LRGGAIERLRFVRARRRARGFSLASNDRSAARRSSKDTTRMMVVRSYLAPSAIEGLGVFAAVPVAKGELVWRFDRRFDQVIPKDAVTTAPEHVREFLERYSYEFHEDPACVILDADEGRYMNHSETPNVDLTNPEIGVAVRDIAAGEELTCDYACFTVGAIEFQPPRAPTAAAPSVVPASELVAARASRSRRAKANGRHA
jgi:SET domain-containing protein